MRTLPIQSLERIAQGRYRILAGDTQIHHIVVEKTGPDDDTFEIVLSDAEFGVPITLLNPLPGVYSIRLTGFDQDDEAITQPTFLGISDAEGLLPIITVDGYTVTCTNWEKYSLMSVEQLSFDDGSWTQLWEGDNLASLDTGGLVAATSDLTYTMRAIGTRHDGVMEEPVIFKVRSPDIVPYTIAYDGIDAERALVLFSRAVPGGMPQPHPEIRTPEGVVSAGTTSVNAFFAIMVYTPAFVRMAHTFLNGDTVHSNELEVIRLLTVQVISTEEGKHHLKIFTDVSDPHADFFIQTALADPVATGEVYSDGFASWDPIWSAPVTHIDPDQPSAPDGYLLWPEDGSEVDDDGQRYRIGVFDTDNATPLRLFSPPIHRAIGEV